MTMALNLCGHGYCGDCASAADSCYTCLQPVADQARLFLVTMARVSRAL